MIMSSLPKMPFSSKYRKEEFAFQLEGKQRWLSDEREIRWAQTDLELQHICLDP